MATNIDTSSHEKSGFFARGLLMPKSLADKISSKVVEVALKTKKLGKDDPRRVYHSAKVGLALSIISLFYYYQPLYDSFGVSAMWAVVTIVVVFEFSVGATLGKCINRGLATLLGGALGLGAHKLAALFGDTGKPIVVAFFVFLHGGTSTFIRFYPGIKARYDYGMLISIMTFSLVSVSGFHDDVIVVAQKRLSTILIGCSVCVIISICICPVWAGSDLHHLVSLNLDKLGSFLEGFGDEYFRTSEEGEHKSDKSFLQGFKSVLNTKTIEENLVNFARWEPSHHGFKYGHPWKQYVTIGTLTRRCAYRIETLSGYLLSNSQVPSKVRGKLEEVCRIMSYESGRALKEVASVMNTRTVRLFADMHVYNSKLASQNLKSLLKSDLWDDTTDLLDAALVVSVAMLLDDIVTCTEKITESVHELALLAEFKPSESLENTRSKNSSQDTCELIVIETIKE